MNVVQVTNKIALFTVALLMYWVFIYISSTVFGFKTFGESITELFILSILGIFSILVAAITINIMYNLTAIAEGRDATVSRSGSGRVYAFLFMLSLVLVFVALYAGDLVTNKKVERRLVTAASDC